VTETEVLFTVLEVEARRRRACRVGGVAVPQGGPRRGMRRGRGSARGSNPIRHTSARCTRPYTLLTVQLRTAYRVREYVTLQYRLNYTVTDETRDVELLRYLQHASETVPEGPVRYVPSIS
jgi:hypothetical protein